MKAVIDTGPLLFLSKIQRLSILEKFGNILVPEGVIFEIRRKPDDALYTVLNALTDWLTVGTVKDKILYDVLTKELDEGESEVICLALELQAKWVIIDDQDARRYAHRYGLDVIGTIGLLAWAKKKGFITSFRSDVVKLQKAGVYATPLLIERLLKEVGEG
jgi:predicted nucleic acid-binding protein